jgi:hypothetical protein
VAPQVVRLRGLIQRGDTPDGAVQQPHRRAEQITKDARDCHHDIDARTAEYFERDHFNIGRAIHRIAHGPHAQQPQRLRDAFALRLDVIQSP